MESSRSRRTQSLLGGIGLRLTVPTVLAVAVLFAVVAAALWREMGRSREATLASYSALVGRVVLHGLRDAMLSGERQRLRQEIVRLAAVRPVRAIDVLDKRGHVTFSNRSERQGTRVSSASPTCQACHGESDGTTTAHRAGLTMVEDGRRTVRSLHSVEAEKACRRCHKDPKVTTLGVLRIDLDEEELTGGIRDEVTFAVLLAAGLSLVLVVVLFVSVRRVVVTRVRALHRLVEDLRAGARGAATGARRVDELDDLARSLHALTADLDRRRAVSAAAAALSRVLEQSPGVALVCDAAGTVLAANRRAEEALADPRHPGRLVGVRRQELLLARPELHARALEEGWAFDAAERGEPVVLLLSTPADEGVALLELWPAAEATPSAAPEEELASASGIVEPGRPAWDLYAWAVLRPLRTGGGVWRGFSSIDPRMVAARRLARQLADTVQGLDGHEALDVASETHLVLHDLERELRDRGWHVAVEPGLSARGPAPILHALLERLHRAAAEQAGAGGEVVLFARRDAERGGLFLGAWAGRPGASARIDPAGEPPFARAIVSWCVRTMRRGGPQCSRGCP